MSEKKGWVVTVRTDRLDQEQVRIALDNGLAKIGQCSECGSEVLVAGSSAHKVAAGYKLTCMQCHGISQREIIDMVKKGEVKLTPEQLAEVAKYKALVLSMTSIPRNS